MIRRYGLLLAGLCAILSFAFGSLSQSQPAIAGDGPARAGCFTVDAPKGEPETAVALYRWSGARWSCTHTLSLGDRARVVLHFKWRPSSAPYDKGWDHPAARLIVVKSMRHYVLGNYQVGTQGLLFASTPMLGSRPSTGFVQFRVDVRIPHDRRWMGTPSIQFLVGKEATPSSFANGSPLYGIPVLPQPKVLNSPHMYEHLVVDGG